MEEYCGVWWTGVTVIGNGDGFLMSAKGRYQRRRDLHISWSVRILIRGGRMVEREFAETVDTA